jgi:hypothetical protein
MSKASKILFVTVFLCAFVVIFLAAGIFFEWTPIYNLLVRRPNKTEIEKLKAESQTVLDALDAYKKQHGHYPATLEEAGTSPQRTRFGPSWYQSFNDGAFCLYAIGSIDKNGFFLSWSSVGNHWLYATE